MLVGMVVSNDAATLIDLADAADAAVSGGKAAPLARLLRSGWPVPPGFVVPVRAYADAVARLDPHRDPDAARALIERAELPSTLVAEISRELVRIGGPSGYVAVRSSATSEDGADAAAGQHDTFLGVRGADAVADAVRRCWASLWSERAVEYRRARATDIEPPATAVLVQRLIDAEVAGVMFTGTDIRIEASPGLGTNVVGGEVTPDSWLVSGGAIVDRRLGAKDRRTDRLHGQVVTRAIPDSGRFCLTDEMVSRLARLGREIEELFGGTRDIEWAIADDRIWLLQARPVTAALPPARSVGAGSLTGTPGSVGQAAGPVRVVRGPSDFVEVRPGDVLVCRTTEPAWTPLFGIVAAVVTEIGGLLSHAAIVAREQGIPAVLAVPDATTVLPEGAMVHVDGDTGRVTLTDER